MKLNVLLLICHIISNRPIMSIYWNGIIGFIHPATLIYYGRVLHVLNIVKLNQGVFVILEGADTLVRKVFEIIDYFKPNAWVIENVGTGLLVNRMKNIRDVPIFITDYCCYGKPVRKRTALWSNKELHLMLCPGRDQCDQMIDNKHKSSVGNGRYEIVKYKMNTPYELFIKKNAIPDTLIDTVIEQLLYT